MIKISDFGFSKIIAETSEYSSICCGTKNYIAPEILFSKESKTRYTTQCDIWSLGVILYKLTYRRYPFPNTPLLKY